MSLLIPPSALDTLAESIGAPLLANCVATHGSEEQNARNPYLWLASTAYQLAYRECQPMPNVTTYAEIVRIAMPRLAQRSKIANITTAPSVVSIHTCELPFQYNPVPAKHFFPGLRYSDPEFREFLREHLRPMVPQGPALVAPHHIASEAVIHWTLLAHALELPVPEMRFCLSSYLLNTGSFLIDPAHPLHVAAWALFPHADSQRVKKTFQQSPSAALADALYQHQKLNEHDWCQSVDRCAGHSPQLLYTNAAIITAPLTPCTRKFWQSWLQFLLRHHYTGATTTDYILQSHLRWMVERRVFRKHAAFLLLEGTTEQLPARLFQIQWGACDLTYYWNLPITKSFKNVPARIQSVRKFVKRGFKFAWDDPAMVQCMLGEKGSGAYHDYVLDLELIQKEFAEELRKA